MRFQKVYPGQPAGKGYLHIRKFTRSILRARCSPGVRFHPPAPRPAPSLRALIFVKVLQDAQDDAYTRVTKSMRYLTFTAPPSREVRKAILRHRSDVLQIAAIYSATREKHPAVSPGSVEFSLRFITPISAPSIN